MTLSNNARRRLLHKIAYSQATGDYAKAIARLDLIIKSDNQLIGLKHQKLRGKSYVSVKQKPEVTASSKLNYNMGDYWYDSLSCVHKRA